MLRRAKHPEVHGVPLYTADNTGAREPTGQVELSEEKRVSASKVIPFIRMLQRKMAEKQGTIENQAAIQLVSNLQRFLQTRSWLG
ncbi:hypothetical protein AGOR_G00131920 [Albula goreensis]|uniref:Uncharacterized protein n=1 Tax=Albula goreensis TaxID=1534307 RepID=A0A8T3D821_9TELE|nr:hypothetical protein AGOR_G00131920 [Albula goreensis]